MLGAICGVSWNTSLFSKDHFHNLLRDIQRIADGSFQDDRCTLILSCLQECIPNFFRTLTFAEQESLATTLMGCYNTAHSIVLRCSVLHALTGLALEAFELVSQTPDEGDAASLSPADEGTSVRLPLWVEEVYALLLATRTATTHRHLKQTVLQADALNACAIRSLEEIQITFPLLSSELDQLVNNSRVSAKRGGAKKETSVDSIVFPSAALRALHAVTKLTVVAHAAHAQKVFVAAPTSERLWTEVGEKRRSEDDDKSLLSVASLRESLSDAASELDFIPRFLLPRAVRIGALLWNYSDQAGEPLLTAKCEKSFRQFSMSYRGVKGRDDKQQQQGPSFMPSLCLSVRVPGHWLDVAMQKRLAPTSFIPCGSSNGTHPTNYVLRDGAQGIGYYAASQPKLSTSTADMSDTQVDQSKFMESFVNSTIRSPIDRTAALSVLPGSSQTYDPRLLLPLTKSLTYACHVRWDSAKILTQKLLLIAMNFSPRQTTADSSSNILRILKHLREHVWYLPLTKVVLSITVATLSLRDEMMISNLAQLLAGCPANFTRATLHLLKRFEAGFAVRSVSPYATLLSGVIRQALLTASPRQIMALVPLLLDGFADARLQSKQQLLDLLVARLPELPNNWYTGHHLVSCARSYLVSELREENGNTTGTQRSSEWALSLVTGITAFLEAILRHVSDAAVAQNARTILSLMQHLPLPTVAFLLDVNSTDVRDALQHCEGPLRQGPQFRDQEPLQVKLLSQESNEQTEEAEPIDVVRISVSCSLFGSNAVVGGSLELYDTDPTEEIETVLHVKPLAVLPISYIGEWEEELRFTVAIRLLDSRPITLYPCYRPSHSTNLISGGASEANVGGNQGLILLPSSIVKIPFQRYIRPYVPQISKQSVTSQSELPQMSCFSVLSLKVWHDALLDLTGEALQLQTVTVDDTTSVRLNVVPGELLSISWREEGDSVLIELRSTGWKPIVEAERILNPQS